jgi:hypothetical protein
MRRTVLTVLAFLLISAPAHARPGDLDRTFADGGRVAFRIGYSSGAAGLTLPDGLRPVVSVGISRDGKSFGAWQRFTTLGRATTTELPATVIRAPLLASGYSLSRIAVAPGTPRQYLLARINSADPVTLTVPDRDIEVTGFGVDGSGRAVLVGYRAGYDLRAQAVRFLPTGQLDTSFAEGGVALLDPLVSAPRVVVKPDGRVYASTSSSLTIVALDAAGRRLAQVVLPAPQGAGYLNELVFVEGPGQTLLLAGSTGSRRPWIARIHADGRPDRRFGASGVSIVGGRGLNSAIHALARDERGRLVAVGMRRSGDRRSTAAFFRFSARGRIDRGFGARGMAFKRLGDVQGVNIVGASADHVAIDDRGRIVVAGQSYDDEFMTRDDQGRAYVAIARLKG